MLIHGDCIREIGKLALEGVKVDMVLVDPPYGITQNGWDTVIDLDLMWRAIESISNENTSTVIFGNQPFTSKLIMSNIDHFKYAYVWKKNKVTGFLDAKIKPLKAYEDIAIFYKKKAVYNPQGLIPYGRNVGHKNAGSNYGSSTECNNHIQEYRNYPKNVLCFDSDVNTIHPTQKPVKLLEYLIHTYTNEGATVIDFCMGSGSTGIACKNTRRRFIGIENDDNHYVTSRNRIEEHEGFYQNNLF